MNLLSCRNLSASVALAAMVFLAGCEQEKPLDPPPTPPPKVASPDKVWSPEEVAADPTGYMNWADAKIGKQIEDRTARIKSLSGRLNEVEMRHQQMRTNLSDMLNIQNRMEMAIRRAEDEDRWPLQMGGRKFERTEAVAIVEQSKKYIEDRKPLAQKYDQAVTRIKSMTSSLNKEIQELNRLREKMALDLEAVRLTQGLEDLDKLRKTEAEITGFATAVGSAADYSIMDVMTEDLTKDPGKVDLDSMLKKQ